MDFANYMGIFLDEGREAMQQLNDMLLRLERAPDDAELLNAVFRTAHTFKGMASTMGFEELAQPFSLSLVLHQDAVGLAARFAPHPLCVGFRIDLLLGFINFLLGNLFRL